MALDGDEMKYVPFTIVCPELKPGQGVMNKEIMVEVVEGGEHEVLTAEAMQLIDKITMQMMLTRLYSCVRELYAAQSCANSPTVAKSDVTR